MFSIGAAEEYRVRGIFFFGIDNFLKTFISHEDAKPRRKANKRAIDERILYDNGLLL
jgi:hypothetical protein